MTSTLPRDPFANANANLAINPAGPRAAKNTLGQADFMRLMTQQLKYQDPLKPLSNSEFIGQLAQFSTVQGISEVSTAVKALSTSLTGDQVLKGAGLVGYSVLVPSEKIALGQSGAAQGSVISPANGTVTVEITDAAGRIVNTLQIDAGKGETAFAWDGMTAQGQRATPGAYTLTARHSNNNAALNTYVQARVDSVSVGSDGIYLNLPGLGTAPLSNVLRIGKAI